MLGLVDYSYHLSQPVRGILRSHTAVTTKNGAGYAKLRGITLLQVEPCILGWMSGC